MITVVNYSAPLRLPEPWRWAPENCPCAACRRIRPARLSRMRTQYRRKQRGWR